MCVAATHFQQKSRNVIMFTRISTWDQAFKELNYCAPRQCWRVQTFNDGAPYKLMSLTVLLVLFSVREMKGDDHPVGYFIQKLFAPKQEWYSLQSKKRISCNKAVSPYLLCVLAQREFLIQDDHQSLKWLDILLYKPISGPEDMTSFQDGINLLSNWVVDNHLALNPLKTKFMYISRSRSFNFSPLLLNGSKLE